MSDPRICIVGAGKHASHAIYPWVGKAGGRIVGVCDLEAAKAERNAARFGGTAYADIGTMVDRERPDAVIACIGPAQHAAISLEMIARGIPVYTEKPPAETSAAALDVARAAAWAGVLCMTGFKKRHAHAYRRAKVWLDQFAPSARLSIATIRGSGAYANDSPLGDHLLDFEIHTIDLVQHLFGDARRVFAMSRDGHAYAVSIEFACGAVGSLASSDGRSFSIPTEKVEITVEGANFMSIDNSSSYRIVADGRPAEWYEPPTFASAGDSGMDSGHFGELAAFVAAVREGRTSTISSIADSYRSMVLYDAIARSAATGRVVDVRYEAL